MPEEFGNSHSSGGAMSRAMEYRGYAAQCIRVAQRTKSPEDKDQMNPAPANAIERAVRCMTAVGRSLPNQLIAGAIPRPEYSPREHAVTTAVSLSQRGRSRH